jgi:hypothetical protein
MWILRAAPERRHPMARFARPLLILVIGGLLFLAELSILVATSSI